MYYFQAVYFIEKVIKHLYWYFHKFHSKRRRKEPVSFFEIYLINDKDIENTCKEKV